MVPHALPALDQAEIPHHAITPAAHASQATTPEQSQHAASMHRGAIPSILDGRRIPLAQGSLVRRCVRSIDAHSFGKTGEFRRTIRFFAKQKRRGNSPPLSISHIYRTFTSSQLPHPFTPPHTT